jgi:phospholipase/carboxylesterase
MHRHHKDVVIDGTPLEKASQAMIMIHGRGGSAEGILSLADSLNVPGFCLLAPKANQQTWYPYSFMAPVVNNQPGLDTGLDVIRQILDDILAVEIKKENIYFLGFSQGACLTSEFLARNADRYGGAFIYSGGLIGEQIDRSNYGGDFGGTPIFLGCSDVDAHVPLHRVQDTTRILTEMGAEVTERIYPNGLHAVLEDEIEITNRILANG